MNLKKNFVKGLVIMSFLCLNASLMAEVSFQCDAELKDYAKELVELELAGARAPQKGQCLKQGRFQYVRAAHDPINELLNQKFYSADPETLVIDEVKKIHDKKRHYRVRFTVQAKENSGPMSARQDTLVFFYNPDEQWGCAHLLFSPEDLYIAEECQ